MRTRWAEVLRRSLYLRDGSPTERLIAAAEQLPITATADAVHKRARMLPPLHPQSEAWRWLLEAARADGFNGELRGGPHRAAPRPARDALHAIRMDRGSTSEEERARWARDLRRFKRLLAHQSQYLSLREPPELGSDPELAAAFREWAHVRAAALSRRLRHVIFTRDVSSPKTRKLGDGRFDLLVPRDHPASGDDTKEDATKRKSAGEEFRRLLARIPVTGVDDEGARVGDNEIRVRKSRTKRA